jgi:hypothetical protein
MSFWEIIKYLGLQTSILCCLDAGAINGVQTNAETAWLDLSGNGNHWISGTDTGTTTGNPRFNGTPGRMSECEYWSGKGNSSDSWFSAPTGLNTTANGWHKDLGVFTYVGVFDPTVAASTNFRCMGNGAAFTISLTNGLEIVYLPGSNVFRFVIDSGFWASGYRALNSTITWYLDTVVCSISAGLNLARFLLNRLPGCAVGHPNCAWISLLSEASHCVNLRQRFGMRRPRAGEEVAT